MLTIEKTDKKVYMEDCMERLREFQKINPYFPFGAYDLKGRKRVLRNVMKENTEWPVVMINIIIEHVVNVEQAEDCENHIKYQLQNINIVKAELNKFSNTIRSITIILLNLIEEKCQNPEMTEDMKDEKYYEHLKLDRNFKTFQKSVSRIYDELEAKYVIYSTCLSRRNEMIWKSRNTRFTIRKKFKVYKEENLGFISHDLGLTIGKIGILSTPILKCIKQQCFTFYLECLDIQLDIPSYLESKDHCGPEFLDSIID